jgi:hypothetical protein
MKKVFVCLLVIFLIESPSLTYADSYLEDGLNYLKSKQDPSGKITNGFSSPSQWTAIVFGINGIDISTIKNPITSLKDFLLIDVPVNDAATDWESRVLSIVGIGENPTSFGGQNYIQKLENFYNNNQIGDTCSLNDDIFGLLALVASGSSSTPSIKQTILDFLISKQDNNGGFSWATPGCNYYETAPDMTAAAIQALEVAKNNELTNSSLDNSITKAKAYLLTSQNPDGGFGYYGSSDSDTTGWALMALNSLEMKESTEAAKARNYLISRQSSTDGGFQAFDYTSQSLVSNSTTTAQSLIALSGRSWVYKIFNPSLVATSSATPTTTSSTIPTPSSISTPNPSPANTLSSYSTLVTTPTTPPTPQPTPSPSQITDFDDYIIPSATPTPLPPVLGINTENINNQKRDINQKRIIFSILSLTNFVGAAIFWKFKL